MEPAGYCTYDSVSVPFIMITSPDDHVDSSGTGVLSTTPHNNAATIATMVPLNEAPQHLPVQTIPEDSILLAPLALAPLAPNPTQNDVAIEKPPTNSSQEPQNKPVGTVEPTHTMSDQTSLGPSTGPAPIPVLSTAVPSLAPVPSSTSPPVNISDLGTLALPKDASPLLTSNDSAAKRVNQDNAVPQSDNIKATSKKKSAIFRPSNHITARYINLIILPTSTNPIGAHRVTSSHTEYFHFYWI